MATVAVFPSVLGVRAGIYDFADRLRAAGHDVRIVDYTDGRTFDDYESALAEADEHDRQTVMGHALALAKDDLPTGLVVAGFSMGSAMAQHVALQMQARAAILVAGASPTSTWGEDTTWPGDCPVQIHAKEQDEFLTDDEREEAAGSLRAGGAEVEVFTYAGKGHLFNDKDLAEEYDAEATDLMVQRVVELLERVD
ncbi:dienelactone hydrolase family protein [Arsenicicoccus dermatophilus]|uniref:dienelactone hydrolase family protein n=1 Tax=Arsenicicoccus dermatophilus TaxID=1076331 RepID=UPI001F4D0137|nr:dienelactone hydrolase family protein [Arsenicicoccus dermatophilus]MCH8612822.1 dienelactone hydrolase family protein [Arsenicicoccus dermatophilus]